MEQNRRVSRISVGLLLLDGRTNEQSDDPDGIERVQRLPIEMILALEPGLQLCRSLEAKSTSHVLRLAARPCTNHRRIA